MKFSYADSPAGPRVVGVIVVLFAVSGRGFGSLRQAGRAHRLQRRHDAASIPQSGASLYAFVALLLLALPEVLTFHVLLALPRLAERKRQF